eukprot:CAMPEP_0206477306 /NCGR_PEP_ID=MMETSP0324_2-20121206/35278_1 /ASSEMBLY_ACC=CAM_ASM_000836 /TAXON_ID=2866 /ORGANISM="Crypthecodinium cohnii, Strain Seligo" /LENGTH=154 /DNA_ID=CAMNT_0053953193 /DNA_START=236 /DNA_END=700 /DNA_ORIENTATION=+
MMHGEDLVVVVLGQLRLLNLLGQEIVCDSLHDLGGMVLLGGDPSNKLVLLLEAIGLVEFLHLDDGFADGHSVLDNLEDASVIVKDAARHLAMAEHCRWGREAWHSVAPQGWGALVEVGAGEDTSGCAGGGEGCNARAGGSERHAHHAGVGKLKE